MKLILFDIDGILIQPTAVKVDYWKTIIKKHFGLEVEKKEVYRSGKTDREILIEFLQQKGINEPEKDERFLPALSDIGNIISEAIKDIKLEKVPNVEKLVKRLSKEKQMIGLLTGNTQEKAEVKLKNANLWKYFKIGAFGDKTKERSELVKIALNEAKEKTGIQFKKEDTYIIGDSIRDIQCAKKGGVNSIAIATGPESIEDLKKEKPNYIFKDFSNTEKIMSVLK